MDISTRTPSYVSNVVNRRTSHVAPSSGPGFGQEDTAAAAFVILSSSIDGGAAGGGVLVVESEAVGGGGGKEVVDSLVSGDFNIVSPDAVLLPPDIGGRGGGAESHLVRKIGSNSDDNTIVIFEWLGVLH